MPKKYLDKFDTEDELVAAFTEQAQSLEDKLKQYTELEKKLGTQGDELGTVRKQLEDYVTYSTQAKPIVDFYVQNEQAFRDWFDKRSKADGQDGRDPAALLTDVEEQALFGKFQQKYFEPFVKQFNEGAQKLVEQERNNAQNQIRAHMDVMWRMIERTVDDPTKLEDLRSWQQESLRYADPSKLDPMAMASEMLSTRTERDSLKRKIDELEKWKEEQEKRAVPSLSGGPPPALFPEQKEAPRSKDDRMHAAFDAIKTEHGADALRDFTGRRVG